MQLNEKPKLIVTEWVKGEPMSYQCSKCGQIFLPPEDRDPKDAAEELLAAFHDHVGEEHAEKANE
jgi:uncharacterized OB-fold protein